MITSLFLGRLDGVGVEEHGGALAAHVERRHLDDEFGAGPQVADLEVRILAAPVEDQQAGGVRVEHLQLVLLRVAAVEARPAPHLHRVRRLIQHAAIARRVRCHCPIQCDQYKAIAATTTTAIDCSTANYQEVTAHFRILLFS